MAEENGKVKIRLTHDCGMPGAQGKPGQVVEVSEEIAEKLIARKGAVLHVPGDPQTPNIPASAGGFRELALRLAKMEARLAAVEEAAGIEPAGAAEAAGDDDEKPEDTTEPAAPKKPAKK